MIYHRAPGRRHGALRIFSYRNKRNLRILLIVVLLAALLLAAVVICRFLYLGRFIVYENGKARLDYDQKLEPTGTVSEKPDPAKFPFERDLNVILPEDQASTRNTQLNGYYITTNMLMKHLDEVKEQLSDLDDINAVMIDVKSQFGNYYYSSHMSGAVKADADIKAIDALIKELASTPDLVVIARLPAFSEPNYAEKHQAQALTTKNGYLWMDAKRCYWLNPYDKSVQGLLCSIALELDALGFDEVLFDNFALPGDEDIRWPYDDITRPDAVLDAAVNIAESLSGSICVDFGSIEPDIAAVADRIFYATDQASLVDGILLSVDGLMENPTKQVVFTTVSRDLRFNDGSVLHPLLDIE